MIRTVVVSLIVGLASCAHAAAETSHSVADRQSSIGYPSVDAALADLTSQPANIVTIKDDWTIITNPNNLTIWSFAPKDHPAYPAAVKRTSVERDGAWYMVMHTLCQAEKEPCDALIAQFKQLNDQMREYIKDQKEQDRPNNSFKPKPLRGSA